MNGRELVITKGSQVKIQRVEWLPGYENWCPRGALSLLAGREGIGKSTIAASMCGHITRLEHTVLYLHSEDSREHTVAPRLKAAGADMDRVLFVDVRTEFTDSGVPVLPMDTQQLENIIIAHRVLLVVLDAATSFMSSQLSGKDDRQVRQYLEPLAQIAARQDCSVLGLCHFGKRDDNDTGKLILGSIAWSQVARSVLAAAIDEESGRIIVTNTKGNLAPRVRSEEIQIVSSVIHTNDGPAEVSKAEWLGETSRSARELLTRDDTDDTDRSEGEAWLEDYLLEQGKASSADVKRAAAKVGIAERTVKRAAKRLSVVYSTEGFPRRTYWSLPSPQSGHLTLTHGPTGPTGPTEPDLGKQVGPTGADSQSGHTLVNGPTGGLTAVTDGSTPSDAFGRVPTGNSAPTGVCVICGRDLTDVYEQWQSDGERCGKCLDADQCPHGKPPQRCGECIADRLNQETTA